MFSELSCKDFIYKLASSDPTPGGGGAAALCGALGAALCSMTARLTVGKKKFADCTEELRAVITEAELLAEELRQLVDRDAEGFSACMAVFALPKDTPDLNEKKTAALLRSAEAPMNMLACCVRTAALLETLNDGKCAAAMRSDLGCAAALTEAAVNAAALNVFANTKLCRENETAAAMEATTRESLEKNVPRLREIYESMLSEV